MTEFHLYYPARRAADAKWKRRARDRRAPTHYWVQGHNARVCSGNSLPKGEGRGGGKLDVEPPSIVLLMTGVRTAGTLAVLLFLFLTAPFCGSSQQVLLTGAKVHTISGDTMSPGQVLVEKGKISAVGQTLSAPNAKVVDLTGQHLYPGLIALNTVLG